MTDTPYTAILIDNVAHTVTEIQMDGSLDAIYAALECTTFDMARPFVGADHEQLEDCGQDVIYVDDEGLFNAPDQDITCFWTDGAMGEPYHGKILVVGTSGDRSVSPTQTIDDIQRKAEFGRIIISRGVQYWATIVPRKTAPSRNFKEFLNSAKTVQAGDASRLLGIEQDFFGMPFVVIFENGFAIERSTDKPNAEYHLTIETSTYSSTDLDELAFILWFDFAVFRSQPSEKWNELGAIANDYMNTIQPDEDLSLPEFMAHNFTMSDDKKRIGQDLLVAFKELEGQA